MKLKYDSTNPKRRVHILDDNGRTYCKAENSSKTNLNTVDNVIPINPNTEQPRKICSTCQGLLERRGKDYYIHSKSKKKNKKQKARRKREVAREGLIKYFGLNKYATNMGICLCIHNEFDHTIPGNGKEAWQLILVTYGRLKGEPSTRRRNFISSKEFYSSNKWRELRYIALQQSEGTCTLCGARASDGVQLHVDHIKPRSTYPELQYDLDNLQILCEDCNLGKSNYDDTDWR